MRFRLMERLNRTTRYLSIGLISLTSTLSAQAIPFFANEVVSYDPGNTPAVAFPSNLPMNQPANALGAPSNTTGEGDFFGVVSIFNPAFMGSQLVSVGEGGHLTLKFDTPVTVGAGREIGVYTNVGMADTDYPTGRVGNPGFAFGIDEAIVEVSSDGTTFFSLGSQMFDQPTQPHLNAGPFDTAEPQNPLYSDFGQPTELSGIEHYEGKTHDEILTMLDGSAGGTWLDLDATGLTLVQYIRFSVLDDGDDDFDLNFEVDAVALNSTLAVPEPGALGVLLVTGVLMTVRRKRNA